MEFIYGRWKQIFPTRLVKDHELNIRKIAEDDAREAGVELLEGPPRAAVDRRMLDLRSIRLEYPARKSK